MKQIYALPRKGNSGTYLLHPHTSMEGAFINEKEVTKILNLHAELFNQLLSKGVVNQTVKEELENKIKELYLKTVEIKNI